MTFIDTSAVVAVLLEEEGAAALSTQMANAERCLTSPAVRLETCMVVATRRDVPAARAGDYFDALASQIGLGEIAIDQAIGRLAVECFGRYGKGRHPAGLNFGDCLSYACAKAHGATLLYTGDDFSKTDIDDRQP